MAERGVKTHNSHQRQLEPLRDREREQRKTRIKGRMEEEEGAGKCCMGGDMQEVAKLNVNLNQEKHFYNMI